MKKYILFFALLCISILGFSEEGSTLSVTFNNSHVNSEREGRIEANVTGAFSEVSITLKDQHGENFDFTITHSTESGKLTVVAENLPAEIYQLEITYEGVVLIRHTVIRKENEGEIPIQINYEITPENEGEDGEIKAVLTGVQEGMKINVFKGLEESIEMNKFYYDPESKSYTVELTKLSEGEYRFKVDEGQLFDDEGQLFDDIIYLTQGNSQEQNPLTMVFEVTNELNQNANGEITVHITTGATQPTVVCYDQKTEGKLVPLPVGDFDAVKKTLKISLSNRSSGTYRFEATIPNTEHKLVKTVSVDRKLSDLILTLSSTVATNSLSNGEIIGTVNTRGVVPILTCKQGATTFAITDKVYNANNNTFTFNVTGLPSGDYTITATDSYGGNETKTQNVGIHINPLSISFVKINAGELKSGKITATITTGVNKPTVVCTYNNTTIPFKELSFSKEEKELKIELSKLDSGSYLFTITDGGDKLSSTATLNFIPNPFSVEFSTFKAVVGNDGKITANFTTGTAEPTVSCKNSSGTEISRISSNYDSSDKRFIVRYENLAPGTYTFEISDGYNKLISTATVELDVNPLSVQFTTINEISDGKKGAITAVITTGSIVPTVTCYNGYNVLQSITSSSHNPTTKILTVEVGNLPKGEYRFVITEGIHQIKDTTPVLYEVVPISATFTVNHVLNSSDAQVTAIISGVTNSSVVTFNKHGDPTPISFTSNFNAATHSKTIVASGLVEGVYELHTSENRFDSYTYVWIGKYGDSTTLCFQPDSSYGQDALLTSLNNPSYSHYPNTNFGTSNRMHILNTYGSGYYYNYRGIIKFQYGGLNKATINQANMTLYGENYENRPFGGSEWNEIYIKRVENNTQWDEHTVTWNNQPISSSIDQSIISNIGGSNTPNVNLQYSKQVDITDMVSSQVEGANENNGFILQLVREYRYRTQNFYTSDYTEPLKRPKFCVTFTLPDQKQLVKVKKKLDGGFITLEDDRKLRFIYQEEYKDLDGKLTYNIYNDKHEVVMTDVLNSLLPSAKRLDVSNIKYGKNTIVLNVDCCLACGEYFILEVINEKQEKWYLRFKTAPKGSNTYIQCHPCGVQLNCAVPSGGSGS